MSGTATKLDSKWAQLHSELIEQQNAGFTKYPKASHKRLKCRKCYAIIDESDWRNHLQYHKNLLLLVLK